jgi:hypothetical protein
VEIILKEGNCFHIVRCSGSVEVLEQGFEQWEGCFWTFPIGRKGYTRTLIREKNAYNNGKATELATLDGSSGRCNIEFDGLRGSGGGYFGGSHRIADP